MLNQHYCYITLPVADIGDAATLLRSCRKRRCVAGNSQAYRPEQNTNCPEQASQGET